jgi:hypothetical protein
LSFGTTIRGSIGRAQRHDDKTHAAGRPREWTQCGYATRH